MTFDPKFHEPQNGTPQQIQRTYEKLVEAGEETDAVGLRRDESTSVKAHAARRLEQKHFTEPSLERKAETAVSEADDLSEEEQRAASALVARAETMEALDADYADELREEAIDLAEYGEPESHVRSLSEERLIQINGLLDRADHLDLADADYAETLRDRAKDVTAKALEKQGVVDSEDETALERDVERLFDVIRGKDLTIDDLEIGEEEGVRTPRTND